MLRVHQSRSATEALSYYTEALSREDYYVGEQEIAGGWGGLAAQWLGLADLDVAKQAFAHLCHNRHPGTGESLTPRTKDDRTVGYDFNFHCPKGVSVVHALSSDQRIVEAFENAVEQTMAEIERDMATRVRLGGLDEDRVTANMLWASFTHFTARPVDGIPDPHLHRHCYAFNATHDPVEERWKAGQFRPLKRDAPYHEAAFYARFAKALTELGYEVERTPSLTKGGRVDWDLAGVPRSVRQEFSKRTAEIETLAKQAGVTRAESKAELGARTRDNKAKHLGRTELVENWDARLSEEDRESLFRIAQGLDPKTGEPHADRSDRVTAKQAVDYALEHAFARVTVVPEKRLLEQALRFGVGSITPEQAHDELASRDILTREVDGQTLVTTPEQLAMEQRMLAFAREGRGTCKPLGLGYADRDGERYRVQDDRLNAQQRSAIEHLLSSADRVTLVRGRAGVGKTSAMIEAAAGIEEGGKQVFAFAPSAEASRGVLREAGFEEAETIAMLLKNPELQDRVKGQVLWIDEYAQTGVPTLAEVFDLAERLDCRVILSGDRGQHGSVEWGDAARLLETFAGVKAAEITEIQRQRGAYKQAVDAIAAEKLDLGFDLLDGQGSILECEGDRRFEQLAKDYVASTGPAIGRNGRPTKRERTALVAAPTNAECDRVTGSIREALKAEGRLGEKDRSVPRYVNQHWDDAEKADAARYEPGMVVVFDQNVKGIRKGSAHRITGVERSGSDPPKVIIESETGQVRSLPLDRAGRFGVYREERLGLASGERIRITKNARSACGHRLNNGMEYGVKGFTREGHVRLENNWILDKSFGHLSHAYASTSYSAQGKTVDRVLVCMGSESFAGAGREQFYVSVSRGRLGVNVYTDDKVALREAIHRSQEQLSATELEQLPIRMTTQQRQQQRAITNVRLQAHRASMPISRDAVIRGVHASRLQRAARERSRGR